MLLHNAARYTLYFGDEHDGIYLTEKTRSIIQNNPFTLPLFEKLKKIMRLSDVTFLHQTHGAEGIVITNNSQKPVANLSVDGDFLVTTMSGLGIGIFTADCLPVICYDTLHNVIGIAHAGWKGAALGVVPAMFKTMQKTFKSQSKDLLFFFGPCAKLCCYEVQQTMIDQFEAYYFMDEIVHKNNNKLYFDLPLFIRLQMYNLGVPLNAFNVNYNECTLCNAQFFSHRRQQQNAGRQITLATLK